MNAAQERLPDLVLLDLMLPVVDGLEVCRRLRAEPTTAGTLVMMLTAKAEEMDQIIGFAVGADDYVTKPFSVKVLLERVKALLRRRDASGEQHDLVVDQGVLVDRRRHFVSVGDQEVLLTPSEFGLLDCADPPTRPRLYSSGSDRCRARTECGRPGTDHRCPRALPAAEAGSLRRTDSDGPRRRLPVSRRPRNRLTRDSGFFA